MSQSAKSQSPNFVIFLALLFGWLLLHPYIMGTAKEEEKPPVSAGKSGRDRRRQAKNGKNCSH